MARESHLSGSRAYRSAFALARSTATKCSRSWFKVCGSAHGEANHERPGFLRLLPATVYQAGD